MCLLEFSLRSLTGRGLEFALGHRLNVVPASTFLGSSKDSLALTGLFIFSKIGMNSGEIKEGSKDI